MTRNVWTVGGLVASALFLLSSVPGQAKKELPTTETMAKLAKDDPVAFLEHCLERYDREIQGYKATLVKQERIDGKLQPEEVIDVAFREKPQSVSMHWRSGARLVESVVHIAGDKYLHGRPNGALARAVVGDVIEREVGSADAKKSSRYTIDEFGMKIGTQRTLSDWKWAQARGDCIEEYLGEQKVDELKGRECFVLRRKAKKPEGEEQITDMTFYFDKDTWLQTGSVLKDKKGRLVASYFFKDVVLNPDFRDDQFDRVALVR